MKQATKMNLSDLYRSDPKKACQLALRRTVNVPTNERLEKINELLEGYGTEGIKGEWQNGYWCDIVAVYVNMGDTYATTVMQVRKYNGCYFTVCDFGSFVEANEKKLGIY